MSIISHHFTQKFRKSHHIYCSSKQFTVHIICLLFIYKVTYSWYHQLPCSFPGFFGSWGFNGLGTMRHKVRMGGVDARYRTILQDSHWCFPHVSLQLKFHLIVTVRFEMMLTYPTWWSFRRSFEIRPPHLHKSNPRLKLYIVAWELVDSHIHRISITPVHDTTLPHVDVTKQSVSR